MSDPVQCKHLRSPELPRRPGNVITVEIGQPLDRCTLRPPEHWGPRAPSVGRWLASGGSPLVLGLCLPKGCPHREAPGTR